MPLFRRKPQLQDSALSGLADIFVNPGDHPTPGVELLNAATLDYTVSSLDHVDDYLDAMRGPQLSDGDASVIVPRAGAYVGEVIRRNTQGREFHWLDYDGAVALDPRIEAMGGKSLGLMAVLWDGDKGFAFPLAKLLKFLQNGRGDSTAFFASGMITLHSRRPPTR